MRKYILVIIICILFCGCQIKNDMAEIQMFAMDTFIDLKAQGENGEKALLEAEKEINRLEKLFSPTIEQSEIFAINQYAAKQTVTVSKDTFDLIEKAKEYCNITEGAFDITKCNLITYANGKYFALGKQVGKFGYSVAKKNKKRK